MKRDSLWKLLGIGAVQNMLHLVAVFALVPLITNIPSGPWSVFDLLLLFTIFSASFCATLYLFRKKLYDKQGLPRKFAILYAAFGLLGLVLTYDGLHSVAAVAGLPVLAYFLTPLILSKR